MIGLKGLKGIGDKLRATYAQQLQELQNLSKALGGLDGISSLSQEEYDAFVESKKDMILAHNNDPAFINRLWLNNQFIDRFDLDTFNALNKDQRDELYKQAVVSDVLKAKYGKDDDYPLMQAMLDTDAQLELVKNPDFIGSEARKAYLRSGIESAKIKSDKLDKDKTNSIAPFTTSYGATNLGVEIAKVNAAADPYEEFNDNKENDQKILDKLSADTQKRREQQEQPLADKIYESFINADKDGTSSLAQTEKMFDTILERYSNHYKAFKNSKWLADYSHDDKLKDFAMYQALSSKYGDGIALQYLDRTIQDKVAEAQDWAWTGNTLKKAITTAYSDIGAELSLLYHADDLFNPDRMAIWNMGKNPDVKDKSKPIYDENGNIIDYEFADNDSWFNPAYWQDVYKYNHFTSAGIQATKEAGGISDDVNVKRFGYDPSFFSWDSFFDFAQEGWSQIGHGASQVVLTGIGGGVLRGTGLTLKTAMRLMGASEKFLRGAGKAGAVANDVLVALSTGISPAQMESMGTFEESMQDFREQTQAQIRHELREYYNSLDLGSEDAKKAIEPYFQKLKEEDRKRLYSAEGMTALPKSDETLWDQAQQMYVNNMLSAKEKQLQNLHKKDEIDAARAAAIGYTTDFIMEYLKEVPINTAIQKFKFAKGSMQGTFDESPLQNIVKDAITGGVKQAVKNASAKAVAKDFAKQIFGGFGDEYLDGLNSAFSQGVASNEFNNYMNKTYNPEIYNAAVDNMLGNMLSGAVSEITGITDINNIKEGIMGMYAPVVGVGPNANIFFDRAHTYNALFKGTDEYGNKLNFAERVEALVQNPLLDAYRRLRDKDRQTQLVVDLINNIVESKKANIHTAAQALATLNDYSSPITAVSSVKGDNGRGVSPLLDSQDQKLFNAFNMLEALKTLENVEGGTKSALYEDTMNNLKGLANGTLSEEEIKTEIDRFLADPSNKSVLAQSNKEEIAAQRLQKNAQTLLDMKEKMDEIQEVMDKSTALKDVDYRVKTMLKYNLVARDNYKERLSSLEEELSNLGYNVGATDVENSFTPEYTARYGTVDASNRAVSSRERDIKRIEKQLDEIATSKKKIEDNIESLKKKLANANGKEETDKVEEDIAKAKTLLRAKELYESTLHNNISDLKEEISQIKSSREVEVGDLSVVGGDTEETEFTEEYVMSLDARDRYAVLNPANSHNYTKKQQGQIKSIRDKLLRKDPEALTKLRDANLLANRIEDLDKVYGMLANNKELASAFMDAAEQRRLRSAMLESVQLGIEKHFSKIEEAYARHMEEKKGKESSSSSTAPSPVSIPKPVGSPMSLKEAILMTGDSRVLDAYLEDHPEQEEEIKPYRDLLKYTGNAAALIKYNKDISDREKEAYLQWLWQVVNREDVQTQEQLSNVLESYVDAEDASEGLRNFVDKLLSGLETLNYQRNATVIENRKKKKEEKDAAKVKREAEEKAARDAAEEAARRAGGTTGPMDSSASGETGGITPPPPPSPTPTDVTGDTAAPETGGTSSEEGTSSTDKGGEEEKGTTSGEDEDNGETGDAPEEDEKKEGETGNKDNLHIVDNGDGTVSGETLDLEQAVIEDGGGSVRSDADNPQDDMNRAEDKETKNGNVLSGNGMSTYESEDLKKGILNPKKPGSEMRNYRAWIESKGINLDEIIDHELSILYRNNPHIKVKFMLVNPEENATHDNYMEKRMMLVVDYDDDINKGITKIHKDSRGGVVESNGKKYLVVGVVGYPKQGALHDAKEKVYMSMFRLRSPEGFIVRKCRDYFHKQRNENKNARFYVPDEYSTEIVPDTFIPGYLINMESPEGSWDFVDIKNLLEDDSTKNPYGYKSLSDLAWGIQMGNRFWTSDKDIDVMIPQDTDESMGKAFFMVPAANGKYVPAYIKTVRHSDIAQNSALYNEVDALLQQLTDRDYNKRLEAVAELTRKFYMKKDDDFILLSKTGAITFCQKGKPMLGGKFHIDTISVEDLRNAFRRMNPRVNFTPKVLTDPDELEKYSESGVLKTNLTRLGTVGSSYCIHGLSADGNMLPVNDEVVISSPQSGESTYRRGKFLQIPFLGQNYRYDKEKDKYYPEGGNPGDDKKAIADTALIRKLELARRIIESKLKAIKVEDGYEYFILGTDPLLVVCRRIKTRFVEELQEEEAQEIFNEFMEKRDREAREENARQDLDIDLGEIPLFDDEELGGEIPAPVGTSQPSTSPQETAPESTASEEGTSEETAPNEVPSVPSAPVVPISGASHVRTAAFASGSKSGGGTMDFNGLMRNRKFKTQLINVVAAKWPGKEKLGSNKLKEFLASKGIIVDAIDTENFEAWLMTIRNCRQ